MEKQSAVKLRKLMELARRNPSPAEAEAAALAAQRLALRIGLDGVAGVHTEGRTVREIATAAESHLPWWARRLAVIVAGNFACEALLRREDGRQCIAFVGVNNTPDAACFSFVELANAHRVSRRAFGKGSKSVAALNDFTLGFLSGVETLLQGQAQSEALVVQTPPEVHEYIRQHRPTASRKVRIHSALDKDAWSEGFLAGRRAGRKPKRLPAGPPSVGR
jgi:hypothetical protein